MVDLLHQHLRLPHRLPYHHRSHIQRTLHSRTSLQTIQLQNYPQISFCVAQPIRHVSFLVAVTNLARIIWKSAIARDEN